MSATSPRYLRLTACCPRCHAPPRLRTFPDATTLLEHHDPEAVMLTYECHIRSCRTIYEIRVKDFHDAA